tara:strand:+ start:448 stop:1095 length:648 start_codon:yes stop_codon:yes gene_type:complete
MFVKATIEEIIRAYKISFKTTFYKNIEISRKVSIKNLTKEQEPKSSSFYNFSEEDKARADQYKAFIDQHMINVDNKVTDEIYSKLYFVRYQYMAVILNALAYQRPLSWKELNQIIYSNLPKRIVKQVPPSMGMAIIQKMLLLDYINIKEIEKNYFEYSITSLGLQVVKDVSIHNIAATTFFSYQTQRLNKLVVTISVVATIVYVLSMTIAFMAFK